MTSELEPKILKRNIGKNIQKIRVYLGVKQESLAIDLDISQQAVSNIEQQEEVEEDILKKIAQALGVSPDIIRNFDEEKSIYNINNIRDNTFAEGSTSIAQQFNPIEKIVELYERLLKSEREKIDILLNTKK